MSLKTQSLRKLSGVDAYARAEGHLVERTSIGAIITIISAVLAAVLFANEFSILMQPQRSEQMGVDTHRSELLRINLNMSFPSLPCQAVSMDLADMATGVHSVAVANAEDTRLARGGQLHKYRLDRHGRHIGAHEYIRPRASGGFFVGAMGDLQDPAALSQALKEKEGCQVSGFLDVQRVAGNLHFSVSMEDFFMLHDTQAEMSKALKDAQAKAGQGHPVFLDVAPDTTRINVSHIIHTISFGGAFPGQVNPLDGYRRMCDRGSGTFKYFLKVVPTMYQNPSGRRFETSQFSVTEYYSSISKGRGQMPAVFFIFDLSPISVSVVDSKRSVAHFLVRVCAVIGGVFAVTGMVDRFVHHFVVRLLQPPPPRLRPGLMGLS